jgi:hypothetical protein
MSAAAPAPREALKRALHWIGGALGIAGIAFVAVRLRDHAAELDLGRFSAADFAAIAGLALAYGAANLLLARAWWHLLAFLGTGASPGWAVRAYGLSQLAKYVPGNIFHLAGRQALGISAGLPGWALAKSAVWELGLISVAGALFAILASPLVLTGVPLPASWIAFAVALVALGAVAKRRLGAPVSRALGLQATFLAISGLVFVGTLGVALPDTVDMAMLSALCGAYVVAWLAGLATPGAPAGIGVRELLLLFLLGGRVPEAELLVAVVLGRIVTVGGDLAFFLAVSLLGLRERRHAGTRT